ncbi:HNH endonuclease [Pseudomonas rhodesiae]|uniref:HNH endonuclease n=1 Tax=Pseudomonas rhodesiae TaxID=76760 RepID=A0AAE8HJP8_9PSED|nr:hypothetical protein [Pseudomonas rhodesiae]TWR49524.1 hypothetical protein FIV35_24990 [Pseudomonas rhodesiae]SDU86083.1 hypothetical protein SAMN04490209_0010 [Pseudomonas rhodesiae]SDV16968.1 hypothetical protein SAMN04490209_5786 [Pseudomonas rhodesiae]
MRPFDHVHGIDDLKSLSALTTGYSFLHGTYNAIEKAYDGYLKKFGTPQLVAVGLTGDQRNCMHKAYEGGAKKYGLNWIPKLRELMLGSCPMCGNSAIGTVEHYLPKTYFPEFTVFSWNLVPSCNTCNQKRGSKHVNGVAHHLLHPIFDKSILGRLKLVTRFKSSSTVTQYELGFNDVAFSADDRGRIMAHIEMCVDRRAFNLSTNVQISKITARLAKKDISLWKSVIQDELIIMDDANVGYGWEASCLRGLLDVDVMQLRCILVSKLLQ